MTDGKPPAPGQKTVFRPSPLAAATGGAPPAAWWGRTRADDLPAV